MLEPELIIQHLCSAGFYIIDNFLETTEYESLQKIAKETYEEGLFKKARIGLQLQAQQNNTIRQDEIFWFDETNAGMDVQIYLNKINELGVILNQSLFLSLAEFEAHFAAYSPGAFYKKHIDQFAAKKNRKISCVYYLNEHWQEDFGGELKLYNKENELLESILPIGNRFICFNSQLPHEVSVTHQLRYSIAGWMKTRDY